MSEKTEPPTPKRLREAREKGQVAKSRDLVGALLFAAIMGTLLGTSDTYVRTLGRLLVLPGEVYGLPFIVALREIGIAVMNGAVALVLPMLGVVLLTGIAGNVVQTGFLLSFKAMKPDIGKINPGKQLKQMFSVKNLIEFVKSIVKIVLLSVILYMVIKDGLRDLLYSATCGLGCSLGVGGGMLTRVVIYTAAVFLIIAAFDFYIQYAQHIKELRMSKDEIKREYKEAEGDPHIKGKRKQLHQELLMEDTRERVRKSSVLVTNPTEIAVALYYEAEKTLLPFVAAKGQGHIARSMIAVAQEEGIPIMRNIPLARSLHEQAPVDQYIPSSLIEPVAEVLRWVQTLERS